MLREIEQRKREGEMEKQRQRGKKWEETERGEKKRDAETDTEGDRARDRLRRKEGDRDQDRARDRERQRTSYIPSFLDLRFTSSPPPSGFSLHCKHGFQVVNSSMSLALGPHHLHP